MTFFSYKAGFLHAEDVSISAISDTVGTPFYCYSEGSIEKQYRTYIDAFADQNARICYAVKANDNIAILRCFANLGAGADVVSGGELKRALSAGIPADKVIFSGIGKTREELIQALNCKIMQINIESFPEMTLLNQLASNNSQTVKIAIRVNPNVDAKTNDKISTGRKQDKFGIDIKLAIEAYRRAAQMPGLKPSSVAVHIGSQLTSLDPFYTAFKRVAELVVELRAAGHDIQHIDLGGGLGINYDGTLPPTAAEYARAVKETLGYLGCQILLEPGRNLVGNAGILVSRVIYPKRNGEHNFLIVDAAMNNLIRPALYGAFHAIRPVQKPVDGSRLTEYDVVGPICETGDTFARNRNLPAMNAGDLLIFDSAGAYSAVMSSTYNARPQIPEVMVRGDRYSIVRSRQNLEDMMRGESFAFWQLAGD